MNKFVVVGGDHHNTLGIIESLALRGIRPMVIIMTDGSQHSFVLKSRNIERGWCCRTSVEMMDVLLKYCKSMGGGKSAVLSAGDIMTCMLDEHRSELEPYFHLPISINHRGMESWMDKDQMSNLAEKVGLNVPERWVIENHQIPEGIMYPCITKAISSTKGSKFDMRICRTQQELREFISGAERCSTFAVQRFIDKEYEFQFLGCAFNGGKDVLVTGRTHIDRPNGLDNTFFLRFGPIEEELQDVVAKCKAFIAQCEYEGTFSIEFLMDKNGVPYFTEMNFRNDGNAICQTTAGINVPYIWYLYVNGEDYQEEIAKSNIKSVYLIPELQQIKFWLQHEISFDELIRDFRMADVCTTYFPRDKRPFVYCMLYTLSRFRIGVISKSKMG